MTLTPAWTAALSAAGLCAAVMAVAAAAVRREVAELQRSLRPLRVTGRHPRR